MVGIVNNNVNNMIALANKYAENPEVVKSFYQEQMIINSVKPFLQVLQIASKAQEMEEKIYGSYEENYGRVVHMSSRPDVNDNDTLVNFQKHEAFQNSSLEDPEKEYYDMQARKTAKVTRKGLDISLNGLGDSESLHYTGFNAFNELESEIEELGGFRIITRKQAGEGDVTKYLKNQIYKRLAKLANKHVQDMNEISEVAEFYNN